MTTSDTDTPAHSPSRVHRWRRRLLSAILRGLILLLPIAIMITQLNRMILPGQSSQGRPEATFLVPSDGAELILLSTAGGDRIAALFGPALLPNGMPDPEASSRPTLLFFYGNAMSLAASLDLFTEFRRLGANVMIPDYLGYGLSEGRASERGCYRTADACFDHLRGRPDVDPSRIVAAGWSIGGAVAIDLAARRPVAGLAVFSTVTSLADVARSIWPWLPAVDWILANHRFASLDKIPRVRGPVFLAHGTDDTIIPHAMMLRLAEAAPGKVSQFSVPGAGHNDFFSTGGEPLWTGLREFLAGIQPVADTTS